MNEKQTRKITTLNDGIGVFNMNLTLVSGKNFCYSVNRKLNFELVDAYPIYDATVAETLGVTGAQNPVISMPKLADLISEFQKS